jgi:hypothetical protein
MLARASTEAKATTRQFMINISGCNLNVGWQTLN